MSLKLQHVKACKAGAIGTGNYGSVSSLYPRTAIVHKALEPYVPGLTIVSEDTMEYEKVCDNGFRFDLTIRVHQRTVEFDLDTNMEFRGDPKEVTFYLNRMNDESRRNNFCGFWSLGRQGRVHLYTSFIDNGSISQMDAPLVYLVTELLELAENSVKGMVGYFDDHYAPSPSDSPIMFR